MKFQLRKKRGFAMLTTVAFLLLIASMSVFGVTASVSRSTSDVSDTAKAKESYFVSEAGNEDMVYRLKNGLTVSNSEILTINGHNATTETVSVGAGKVGVLSTGDRSDYIRKISTVLNQGSGTAFFYGIQVGQGGVSFNNSSNIVGNLYSNGPIVGTSANLVKGDIISVGPAGSITGMHATGTLYAHTLANSIADKDAYYQVIDSYTSSHVAGTKYPNSPDQVAIALPISDEMIANWENDAVSGGTATCSGGSYVITGTVTIGPKKIPCDLYVSNDGILTLTGAIWVTGNITFSNSADIKISSSLSGKSVPIIADKTSNQTSSSRIEIANTTQFFGYGSNSFILLISQNKSAELGGGTSAINISNSINGDVLIYAGHGLVNISNSASVKEITAYKIQANNSASVVYNTGLANLVFQSGPSGGYTFDSWKEVE